VSPRPIAKSAAIVRPRDDARGLMFECGDPFGPVDHRREETRPTAGGDSEHGRAREVDERERRRSVHGKQRPRPVDRDEREIAARRRDQRREQHPPGEVFLERHLDREDRTRSRRFEDRGDARGGAGNQEQVAVGADQKRTPPPLQRRADRGAHVDGRTLEPHRAATAERRDRCNHAREHVAHSELAPHVKCAQVLVGCARRYSSPGIAQPECGTDQTRAGRERHQPQRQVRNAAVEHDVDRQPIEPGDRDAGDRTDNRRREHYLARASDDCAKVGATIHTQPGVGTVSVVSSSTA